MHSAANRAEQRNTKATPLCKGTVQHSREPSPTRKEQKRSANTRFEKLTAALKLRSINIVWRRGLSPPGCRICSAQGKRLAFVMPAVPEFLVRVGLARVNGHRGIHHRGTRHESRQPDRELRSRVHPPDHVLSDHGLQIPDHRPDTPDVPNRDTRDPRR
jgi:hypothetical protein